MNILLIGATGSVGENSLEVIKRLGHRLVGCVFGKNIKKMQYVINLFKYNFEIFSPEISIFNTVSSVEELISKTCPDLIINAVSGFDGLQYTLMAIENNINIALANKESYVLCGGFINELAKSKNVSIYPIDSELCALYHLSLNKQKIKKLYLTASGGSFFNYSNEEISKVTFDEATKHPTWKMGSKISIDSSTLMNKCFEVIAAYVIFKNKNISVLHHPQSIIHGLVEFNDNSFSAQLYKPNMKLAISLAISKFNSKVALIEPLDFDNLNLTLNNMPKEKYLPIKWAFDVIENDDWVLANILISANDYAIQLFKEKRITFKQIFDVIYDSIGMFRNKTINNIEDIYNLNSIIKKYITSKY